MKKDQNIESAPNSLTISLNDRSLLSRPTLTRLEIVDAMQDFLDEGVGLDRLSTRELCTRASVSKSTFYKYFEDKYSVVQWILNLVYDQGVANIGRSLSWRQGHEITTHGFFTRKSLFVNAGKSMDYNAINSYSVRKREQDMTQTLEEYRGIKVTPRLRGQIIAVAASETAILSRVASESIAMSEQELIDLLVHVVPQELFELLDTPHIAK